MMMMVVTAKDHVEATDRDCTQRTRAGELVISARPGPEGGSEVTGL